MGIVFQFCIGEPSPIDGLGFAKAMICDEAHCIFRHLNLNAFQRFYHLKVIRDLMGVSAPPEKEVTSLEEMMLQLTGTDITSCPCCSKGEMHFFAEIPRGRARPPSRLICAMG